MYSRIRCFESKVETASCLGAVGLEAQWKWRIGKIWTSCIRGIVSASTSYRRKMTLVGWDGKVSFEHFAFHLGQLLSQSRGGNFRYLAEDAKCKQQRAGVSRTSCTCATRKLSRCQSLLRLELTQITKFLVPTWKCPTFFQIDLNFFWKFGRPVMSSQEYRNFKPRTHKGNWLRDHAFLHQRGCDLIWHSSIHPLFLVPELRQYGRWQTPFASLMNGAIQGPSTWKCCRFSPLELFQLLFGVVQQREK